MRSNGRKSEVDAHAVQELVLYTENDAQLFDDRSQAQSIRENLYKRFKKGTYDHSLAPKLWGYLMDSAAAKYVKEMGSPGARIDSMFTKATRMAAAQEFADSFYLLLRSGEYERYRR